MDRTLFRDLDEKEEKKFRNWARENFKPMSKINTLWHPVVQEECKKMNDEFTEGN